MQIVQPVYIRNKKNALLQSTFPKRTGWHVTDKQKQTPSAVVVYYYMFDTTTRNFIFLFYTCTYYSTQYMFMLEKFKIP